MLTWCIRPRCKGIRDLEVKELLTCYSREDRIRNASIILEVCNDIPVSSDATTRIVEPVPV